VDSAEARTMALRAISQGLLRPDELWDLAWRCGQHEGSPVDRFLETTLGGAKIHALTTSTEASAGPSSEQVAPPPADGARYEPIEDLGSGGMGHVLAALDREAQRIVAVKRLNPNIADDPVLTAHFVREARLTAQLEHPNIIPVYDLGTDADGKRFFTMRVVKQRSLRDVLRDRHKGMEWPTVRLLGVLVQVSRALAYAHSRGVVHRDVKPANILLGDFGEVYLADWGLARVHTRGVLAGHPDAGQTRPAFGGSPGYIAPEVLDGTWDGRDPRVDLFAMGVVLYEIVTGRRPFLGDSADTVLRANAIETPPRPRELAPDCPLLLEDLCLSLLAREPRQRPESSTAVAERIEAFLEGAKERERRGEEARGLCARAREAVVAYERLEQERDALARQARELLPSVRSWEGIDKKRPCWELQDRAADADREAGLAQARGIELFTSALGYDAASKEARRGLADLYWSRARAAEEERRLATQLYYESLVAEYDTGHYAEILGAGARLSVQSSPTGARVVARRYLERDRVLVLGEARALDCTPVTEATFDPGTYLITLELPGYRDVRYPVLLGRGVHHQADVRLYTESEIGDGFIYVPRGAAILGGDAEAFDPVARLTATVDDFAIATFPVTMGDYCAFLDDLDRGRAGTLARRTPHDLRGSEGRIVHRDTQGRWRPDPHIIEGEARKAFPLDEHLEQVPVSLVDWFDAMAGDDHEKARRFDRARRDRGTGERSDAFPAIGEMRGGPGR